VWGDPWKITLCVMDTWCDELGLRDGRYVWSLWLDGHGLVGEICATFMYKFPHMCYVRHSSMHLSNEPCTYVQGLATHSYMYHPVTVKRSYLLKGSFERVICCVFLMFFMYVHLCGFCTVNCTTVKIMFFAHNLS